MPAHPTEPARNPLVDRDRLLGEFDMMTRADFAALVHKSEKTVQNAPRSELPPFIKVGREWLFSREAVRQWLEERTVDARTVLRTPPKPKPARKRSPKRTIATDAA